MNGYKNILVAVELIDKTDADLLKQAADIAQRSAANITLVHAVEYLGTYNAYGVGVGFEVDQILMDNANEAMNTLGKSLQVPEERRIVKMGPAKYVILEEAENVKADLIVVGSHGRHGLRAILGSTADGVLHGAKCDVLAVRFKE